MTTFSVKFKESQYREGETIKIEISWDGPVSAATTIKWDIVFSGALPTSSNDFAADDLAGSYIVQKQDKAGMEYIMLNVEDDKISEPIEDLVVRLSLDDNNEDTKLATTEISTKLADNDLAESDSKNPPYVLDGLDVPYFLTGDSLVNVFTLGTTQSGLIEGFGGDDQYIVTRYQTANVEIRDTSGTNVLRFDDGVAIQKVESTGRGATGKVTLANGAVITTEDPGDWMYQLGEAAAVDWDTFEPVARAAYTAGTPIIVSGYLGAAVGTSTTLPKVFYGGTPEREDVYTFGEESEAEAEGFAGVDTYIITRFQSGDLTLRDGLDGNLLKFDVGVAIKTVESTGRGSTGKVTLQNGAVIKVDDPGDWRYQFGDGEVIDWDAFEVTAKNGYTVALPGAEEASDGLSNTGGDEQLVENSLVYTSAEGEVSPKNKEMTYALSVTPTTGDTDESATAIRGENQTQVMGTYGTLYVKTDGTWMYVLDDKNTAIDALNSGQTVDETFAFTYTNIPTESISLTIEGRTDVTISSSAKSYATPTNDNFVIHKNRDSEQASQSLTISTGSGNDIILPGTGNGAESISSGKGNDELYGGGGADKLLGGEGNDVLDGGLGRDTLTGGTGDDIFALNLQAASNADIDIVMDFGTGDNQIRVAASSDTLIDNLDDLEDAANFRWTNKTDYSALNGIDDESTNVKSTNDTIIWHTRGTESTSDDIVLMVLEDYNTALIIDDFDII